MEADKYGLTEKTIAEVREKYGLNINETPKNTLFQGDFGTSINLFILIPSLIFLLVVAILLFLFIKRRKNNN